MDLAHGVGLGQAQEVVVAADVAVVVREALPRKSASVKAWRWSSVPIAPSSTRIRSRRSPGRRSSRVARVNGVVAWGAGWSSCARIYPR